MELHIHCSYSKICLSRKCKKNYTHQTLPKVNHPLLTPLGKSCVGKSASITVLVECLFISVTKRREDGQIQQALNPRDNSGNEAGRPMV